MPPTVDQYPLSLLAMPVVLSFPLAAVLPNRRARPPTRRLPTYLPPVAVHVLPHTQVQRLPAPPCPLVHKVARLEELDRGPAGQLVDVGEEQDGHGRGAGAVGQGGLEVAVHVLADLDLLGEGRLVGVESAAGVEVVADLREERGEAGVVGEGGGEDGLAGEACKGMG